MAIEFRRVFRDSGTTVWVVKLLSADGDFEVTGVFDDEESALNECMRVIVERVVDCEDVIGADAEYIVKSATRASTRDGARGVIDFFNEASDSTRILVDDYVVKTTTTSADVMGRSVYDQG